MFKLGYLGGMVGMAQDIVTGVGATMYFSGDDSSLASISAEIIATKLATNIMCATVSWINSAKKRAMKLKA